VTGNERRGLVLTDINRKAAHLQTMIGLTPLGRAAEPSDIAALVAFLASDEARMITAEEVVVDGKNGAFYVCRTRFNTLQRFSHNH
jgi:NAD(P)-dependent dehydrogenase (short-subunit alcohol dehydrogenase family)